MINLRIRQCDFTKQWQAEIVHDLESVRVPIYNSLISEDSLDCDLIEFLESCLFCVTKIKQLRDYQAAHALEDTLTKLKGIKKELN